MWRNVRTVRMHKIEVIYGILVKIYLFLYFADERLIGYFNRLLITY